MRVTDSSTPANKQPLKRGTISRAVDAVIDYFKESITATSASLKRSEERCVACRANIPPHSVEAEHSVLGGLLFDNTAWEDVAEILIDDDFYRAEHRLIFGHIYPLIEGNKLADALTVAESLECSDQLESVGGRAYIDSLVVNTSSVANIRIYAEIVRERAIMRRLATVATEIKASIFSPMGRSAKELLKLAELEIHAVAESAPWRRLHGFVGLAPLLTQVLHRIDSIHKRAGDTTVSGLPTGFPALDRLTGGLQAGNLVIVAGRQNMGKTAFALNIAQHAALNEKKPAAIFSMGNTGAEMVARLLGVLGYLDQHRMCSGSLNDDDWNQLTKGVEILNDAPIYIDESATLTPFALRGRARRLHRPFDRAGLGVIVVDGVELMMDRGSVKNHALSGDQIMTALKAVAEELNIPVVALLQLSNDVDLRQNKRPIMSDLREFGFIEQYADLVLFIHREEVDFPENLDARGKAEAIIGRQRNGPTGTVNLTFLDQYAAFERQAGEESVR